MKRLHSKARKLLDRYLCRVRMSLVGHTSVDHIEIERDVRDHIEAALDHSREPVTPREMSEILERLGSPSQWVPDPDPVSRPTLSVSRDDWRLAYLSLALLVLAVGLPPFLWIGLFGAFLTARASLCAATRAGGEARDAQHWLRLPALLVVYVPTIAVLLLWPAVATRLLADEVLHNPALTWRVPFEVWDVARRVAELRLSSFDPFETMRGALRSGHYLVAPVGLWLIVLGIIARAWPRPFSVLLRPIAEDGSLGFSRSLLVGGVLLCCCAFAHGVLKLLICRLEFAL